MMSSIVIAGDKVTVWGGGWPRNKSMKISVQWGENNPIDNEFSIDNSGNFCYDLTTPIDARGRYTIQVNDTDSKFTILNDVTVIAPPLMFSTQPYFLYSGGTINLSGSSSTIQTQLTIQLCHIDAGTISTYEVQTDKNGHWQKILPAPFVTQNTEYLLKVSDPNTGVTCTRWITVISAPPSIFGFNMVYPSQPFSIKGERFTPNASIKISLTSDLLEMPVDYPTSTNDQGSFISVLNLPNNIALGNYTVVVEDPTAALKNTMPLTVVTDIPAPPPPPDPQLSIDLTSLIVTGLYWYSHRALLACLMPSTASIVCSAN